MSQQASSTSLAAPSGSYIARHWRGDISLGWSYWINGAVIGFIGRVLWYGAIAGLSVGVKDRSTLVASLIAMIAITLTIYIWQVVGIWRSARKHVGRGGKRIWAILAMVSCVLGVVYVAAIQIQNFDVVSKIATNDAYWLDPRPRR